MLEPRPHPKMGVVYLKQGDITKLRTQLSKHNTITLITRKDYPLTVQHPKKKHEEWNWKSQSTPVTTVSGSTDLRLGNHQARRSPEADYDEPGAPPSSPDVAAGP